MISAQRASMVDTITLWAKVLIKLCASMSYRRFRKKKKDTVRRGVWQGYESCDPSTTKTPVCVFDIDTEKELRRRMKQATRCIFM